jgi:hypothetical protein
LQGDFFETALFRRLQERREINDLISALPPFQLTLNSAKENLAFTFGFSAEASISRSWLLFPGAALLVTRAGKVISSEIKQLGSDLLAHLFILNFEDGPAILLYQRPSGRQWQSEDPRRYQCQQQDTEEIK